MQSQASAFMYDYTMSDQEGFSFAYSFTICVVPASLGILLQIVQYLNKEIINTVSSSVWLGSPCPPYSRYYRNDDGRNLL